MRHEGDHPMPFGARLLDGDRTAFRLWAPGATRVALELGGQRHPMRQRRDGWFTLTRDDAPAGSRYAFCIDDGLVVPDPASRFQPDDVHAPSAVVDPASYRWQHADWRGRPWEEAVLYELHVGTFSEAGTFAGVEAHLDALVELGITAIELMPLADFPGARNWGYDGVLQFAPDASYGTPHELKRLIDAAHGRGLMVLLDVVYNHFGPDGNYLHAYAPQFFTDKHDTPWGQAINFDDAGCHWVRRFYVHNVLYWLQEYRFDGLRFDAVHAIRDDSGRHILEEIAAAVRQRLPADRHVHLVLENDANQAHFLRRDQAHRPLAYTAQWNDDSHHLFHVLATGESGGYYADYVEQPVRLTARLLAEGFAYQGEPSAYRDGERRGEPSAQLPPTAFVNFLQNHDQVGNRALGERLATLAEAESLRALTAILLLSPAPPMLFMGEEWAAPEPFLFFCDFDGELADAVREGRRREFARFPQFSDPKARAQIPDPNAAQTFLRSRLDWHTRERAEHADWLALHRELITLRHARIVPLLKSVPQPGARFDVRGEHGLEVGWPIGDVGELVLTANLGPAPGASLVAADGEVIYERVPGQPGQPMPPWYVRYVLREAS